MVEVKKYHLPPTALIPNSPYPLLHYPGLLSSQISNASSQPVAPQVNSIFMSNGWRTHWIFRYGQTQSSHYHSGTHECMAVLSGTATIRFGVADTDSDLDVSTYGDGKESGGIELEARAGDVFLLPAGLAHKTYDTTKAKFALLTPGDGHGIEMPVGESREEEVVTNEVLAAIELTGFTMIGAYPRDGSRWDFLVGGEDEGRYDDVWAVPKPELDPVLGKADEGLCGLWK